MRRTVSIWWVIAFLGTVLIAFFAFTSGLSDEISILQSMLDDERNKLKQVENQKAYLEMQKRSVGTDAYIESEARNAYDYMMRDEIRFIISNPHNSSGIEPTAGTP